MSEQFHGIVTIAASRGGTPVITLNGGSGDVTVGAAGRDGDLVLHDAAGNPRVVINGQDGTLVLRDANGQDTVALDSRFSLLDLGAQGSEGDLRIRDNAGTFVFTFDANFALLDIGGSGNEGDLRLLNNAGQVSIHLDGGAGDISLLGADLAEEFASGAEVDPGSVVVAVGPDEVVVADEPCDRRVIGSGRGPAKSECRWPSRGECIARQMRSTAPSRSETSSRPRPPRDMPCGSTTPLKRPAPSWARRWRSSTVAGD
jgi:hypothetical protein